MHLDSSGGEPGRAGGPAIPEQTQPWIVDISGGARGRAPASALRIIAKPLSGGSEWGL